MLLAIGSLALIGTTLGALFCAASRRLDLVPESVEPPGTWAAEVLAAEVLAMLPGYPCGQCGFVGCTQAAAALAAGRAPLTVCRAGGETVARRLAARLGRAAPPLPADSLPEVPMDSGSPDPEPSLSLLSDSCPGCTRQAGRHAIGVRAARGARYHGRSHARTRCTHLRPRQRRH